MNQQRPIPEPKLTFVPPASDAIREIIKVLVSRRRIIIGTVIVAMALTAVLFSQLVPRYTATAAVMLDTQRQKVVEVEAVLSGLTSDPITVENQIQIIKSRELAKKIITDLRLADSVEFAAGGPSILRWFNPRTWFAPSGEAQIDEAAAAARREDELTTAFLKRLDVSLAGRSSVIDIAYTSADPVLSALVANAVADAYIVDQLDAKFEATRRANTWISEQAEKLAVQLKDAEGAVEQYKSQYGLAGTDSQGGTILENQIADVNSQLTAARAARAQAQATYGQTSGGRASVSAVVGSPLIAQLRQQEAEVSRRVAELSDRYQDRHPEVVRARAELRDVRSKIGEEQGRIVGSMRAELSSATALENSLQARLSDLEKQASQQRQSSVGLRELDRKATSIRTMYEAMLSRQKETDETDTMQAPDARVLSKAVVPERASFPNPILMFGLMVPAALMFGVLLAFLLERLDNGFGSGQMIEQTLGIAALGTIPQLSSRETGSSGVSRMVIDKPLSAFAEGVRSVQTGLVLSNVDRPPKVVLVTSAVPGEGKTTFAVSLAQLVARSGSRVVVVDLDLRHSKVLDYFDLPNVKTGGVVEVLSGTIPLSEALAVDPKSGAHLLGVKQKASSPPDLLSSKALLRMIEELRSSFDTVIIDSAPILPVNDTRLFVRHVDAVVLAVRWEKTSRDAVMAAVDQLQDSGASIAGAVLTRTNMRRNAVETYGHSGYGTYANYYQN